MQSAKSESLLHRSRVVGINPLIPLARVGGLCSFVIALTLPAVAQIGGDHQYTSSQVEAGARLYTDNCQLCHGPNGDGVEGFNLRTGLFRTVRSDDDLRKLILNGTDDEEMPGAELNPEELEAVIAYLRAGFDPTGVAARVGDPLRGKELFFGKGKCSNCHRVGGTGPKFAPDLSDIGSIRNPTSLQRSIMDPTAALRPIHRPVKIVTRDGETIRGRRLNEDTYTVQLIDTQARLRSLNKSNLVEYTISKTSRKQPTKLNGDEVADVIGYLVTLRGIE